MANIDTKDLDGLPVTHPDKGGLNFWRDVFKEPKNAGGNLGERVARYLGLPFEWADRKDETGHSLRDTLIDNGVALTPVAIWLGGGGGSYGDKIKVAFVIEDETDDGPLSVYGIDFDLGKVPSRRETLLGLDAEGNSGGLKGFLENASPEECLPRIFIRWEGQCLTVVEAPYPREPRYTISSLRPQTKDGRSIDPRTGEVA